MTEHFAAFAQDDIPNIEYLTMDQEQARCALSAATRLTEYEVSLMPINTPEEALASAQERAAHKNAVGNAMVRKRGAVAIFSSRKEPSPEEFAHQLYQDSDTRLFMKIRMPEGASVFELLREYYESDSGPEEGTDH